jgi:hypothetical protein
MSEVFLDHETLISAADNEIIQSVCGIYFHDMPEDRLAADFDHGLGPIIGFFGEPSPHTTCEDNCFHLGVLIIISNDTHGIAMGSPCVGPQERPKGESSPEFGAHSDAMVYSDAALPGL